MIPEIRRTQIALAVAAAFGAAVVATAPTAYADKTPGTYVTGDFHNHTTCSDGSISMQKLVAKSTKGEDVPWGLDWFVQAGHGGNGNRNCTLAEDETLATPAYPLVSSSDGTQLLGPNTTWQSSNPPVQPKGDASFPSGTPPADAPPYQNMWRWQAVQEFQYPLQEYLAALHNKPLFMGVESVVAGHEHTSMSVITDQMPGVHLLTDAAVDAGLHAARQRGRAGTVAVLFRSRQHAIEPRRRGNQWDCSVPLSLNEDRSELERRREETHPASGTGSGDAVTRKPSRP